MSMTENLDRLLTDSGEYAVYGKALGDKMRAGVQYGPDPVKPSRPLYGVRDLDPNRARIEEINREIGELEAQLASYDMDEEIGSYRFLYENDPSYLSNYRQRKSTEQMNAEMRKATEEANKASTLQSAWKQNAIDLEVAKYDLLVAQHALDEANGLGDSEAVNRADTELNRAKAKYNRVSNENKTLKAQMMNLLGVTEDDGTELEDEATKLLDSLGQNHSGGNGKPEGNKNVAEAETIEILNGELARLEMSITTDNIPISKTDKQNKITEWNNQLSELKTKFENSNLSIKQKQDRKSKILELEKKVRDYAKPGSKGGQNEIVVKDKAYYEKLTAGKNPVQLSKLGYSVLMAAKKAGVPIPDSALNMSKQKDKSNSK